MAPGVHRARRLPAPDGRSAPAPRRASQSSRASLVFGDYRVRPWLSAAPRRTITESAGGPSVSDQGPEAPVLVDDDRAWSEVFDALMRDAAAFVSRYLLG